MADDPRPRYVVLVWMYDHWGVTYSSNDRIDALTVAAKAEAKVPAKFIDTEAP